MFPHNQSFSTLLNAYRCNSSGLSLKFADKIRRHKPS